MPFAEMDWGALAGWMTAGAAAAVAILAAVVAALKDRRKVAIDEWREIVARQDEHIRQLQQASDGCREREMRLTRAVVYLHGVAKAHRDALTRAGQQTEPLRDLDDFLQGGGSDARSRELQQNTSLLHEDAQRVTKSVPPTSGAP